MRHGPWHIMQLITRADWGGAQRHVFDLATRLDPRRFHITVACAPDGVLVDRLREAGIRVITLPFLRREVSVLDDWKVLTLLSNLLREERVDLIHCHSSKAGFLGRLAAKRAGVKAVYTAHGFPFTGLATPAQVRAAYLGLEWLAGRLWTDTLITVSEADAQCAYRWRIASPELVRVVQNGIDIRPYAAIPAPGSHEPPVIGAVTRLVSGKGLMELLDAAKIMLHSGRYRFIIAGSGPLLEPLKRRACDLGIAQHLEFPGFVSDHVSLLERLDACVLPSLKEGLPYSVLEAMAAGRPVAASAVGGLPEIIRDGDNGRLVKPGDVQALAKALVDITQPERLRVMSRRARATVETRFSVERMIREVAAVYDALLV